MQNGKKYYLNVSSYKYKREYMKLYQPYIDKILNTYSNRNQEVTIESQNLCPGGKRCKNYIIIMNLEQKIKELNDTVNQLTKIKEYSESNHNIDFTPMKTMENPRKDAFKEICNSFRNSGIKKKLNSSTRNMYGNNTLQPQISEPYRLKLDFKNVNDENKIGENKKSNAKKLINLDINKFRNIGVRLNAEKLGIDEKLFLNKRKENNDLKNNNANNDEKEKKIQNLINHIFNNKNNELVINKKLEESKTRDIKKMDSKNIKKSNLPKIKVKTYNLLPSNKITKIKNGRYNSDLAVNEKKIEEKKDENKMSFRQFKGNLRNSYNSIKNKFLSKSLGFNTNFREEKDSLFNFNDKYSKTVLEDNKQSLYKLSTLNSFRPLSLTQKPFKLKLDICQNECIQEDKAKSERTIKDQVNNLDGNKNIKDNNLYNLDSFLKLFENKKEEKYQLFKEIYDLSCMNYDKLIEKLKALTNEKINQYIRFIKYCLIFVKDLTEIFHKLNIFYNITNTVSNNTNKTLNKISLDNEIIKLKKYIQKSLACDYIHIYFYDSITDSLILKGEDKEIKFQKDKDLIGKCFSTGNILNYNTEENAAIVSDPFFLQYKELNRTNKILLYPIKDLENKIHGVIEIKNNNSNISDLQSNNKFDKKIEIIMSFISKALSFYCMHFNNLIINSN
jgi:hypothetical protein